MLHAPRARFRAVLIVALLTLAVIWVAPMLIAYGSIAVSVVVTTALLGIIYRPLSRAWQDSAGA
jgi:hypothetical protein